MSDPPLRFTTHSPDGTAALARVIADRLRGGEVIALVGELGSGKTCFCKGLAQGLGIDPNGVTSPTFVLVNEYQGRLHVYHFDAYRLAGEEEMAALGCQEMFAGRGVCLVEWADRVAGSVPADRLTVRFEHAGLSERTLQFSAGGPRHEGLLAAIA